jgi:hypothetical protein
MLPARPDPVGSPSATTPDGGFVLAWVAKGTLVAQAHGPGARRSGEPLVLAEGLPDDLPPGSRVPLQLAADGRGHFLAAWWGPEGAHGLRPLLAVTFEMP